MASTYLNRNASATATTFTYSVWLKRSGVASDYQYFFSYQSSGGGSNGFGLAFNGSTNKMYYYGTGGTATTDAVFRDPSAWYHVVLSVSSGTGTLYVNNETVKSSIAVDQVTSGEGMTIGAYKYGSTIDYQYDGYMAHAHFTDGYAYTPSTFGSTSTNGQWVPTATPSVTYGTNGFFLKFTNASALGEDFSGNNNDFTKSGSGDKTSDSPENVFATMSTIHPSASNFTISDGNLKISKTGTGTVGLYGQTLMPPSGKWYFEVKIVSRGASDRTRVGIANYESVTGTSTIQDSYSGVEISTSSDDKIFIVVDGSTTENTTFYTALSDNDIVRFAVDMDNGRLYLGVNGNWWNYSSSQTGGDPTSGSGYVTNNTTIFNGSPMTAYSGHSAGLSTSNVQEFNFGNPIYSIASGNADGNGEGNFEYAPPTGYLALCTNNLSSALTQPIGKGGSYFKPKTYTGNGTSQTITGVGFQPDFLWIKNREQTDWHNLINSTVGATKRLSSNNTNVENTNAQNVSAFASDGFSVGNDHNTNANGENYISWNWLSNGGTTSSNTDGSLTSTVQANTTAGFSIVTYTGNNTQGATVGHGLGRAPAMIFVKGRDQVTNWNSWHKSFSDNQYITLDRVNAVASDANTFPDASDMTSTSFEIGNASWVNGNGNTFVAYCFAEIEGFSKINKYTGNGNANGPFVYTGFRPSFILMKSSTSGENWLIYDDVRDPHNVTDEALLPNSSSAAGGATDAMDLVSNGFKLRSSSGSLNNSGQTYIYMAFAKNPFVDSAGVPTTAR